jgi:glutaredoxin
MTEIIVYTTETCPKCKKLKEYLESIAVGYEVADMSTPASLTELRANGVFTTMAPVLQVGDSFLTLEEMFDGDRIRKDIIDGLVGRASS